MKINRNNEAETNLYNRIKENYNNERGGIHLSDLLTPRKAFWNKTLPKPLDITEILYFVSGSGIEKELTNLLGYVHGRTRQAYGIYYSPDLRDPKLTEIKSRRAYLPQPGTEEKEFDYYLSQLSGYMALDKVTEGSLLVFSLNEKVDDSYKTQPVIACYDVVYDEKELKAIRKNLRKTKNLLELAIDNNSCQDLPYCPDWMCGRTIRTLAQPAFCFDCNKPFSNDYLLKKHKFAPKSLDHSVRYGVYDYTYEPRCKWFNECRGNINTTELNEPIEVEEVA